MADPSMHTLAFLNQKGGCGKTTTVVHLAGALAARGSRVLVVDLDPQAHGTLGLGCAVENGSVTLADVLLDGADVRSALREGPGGVSVLPSDGRLMEFEERSEGSLRPERLLGAALAPLLGDFDHCLADCPPRTDGALAANALRCADTVVLVVETGAFGLQGALQAVDILEERAEAMDAAFELRVVATLYDRRRALARDCLIGTHARFGEAVFDTVIREDPQLREAAAFGQPVSMLSPAGDAAMDFAALAEEVAAIDPRRLRASVERMARSAARPTAHGVHGVGRAHAAGALDPPRSSRNG